MPIDMLPVTLMKTVAITKDEALQYGIYLLVEPFVPNGQYILNIDPDNYMKTTSNKSKPYSSLNNSQESKVNVYSHTFEYALYKDIVKQRPSIRNAVVDGYAGFCILID